MGWLMHILQQRQKQQQQQFHKTQQQTENPGELHVNVGTETQHLQPQNQNQQQNQLQQPEYNDQSNSSMSRKVFWLFCLILYATTNFMSYWRSTPSWMVATIMSVGKLLFSLSVGGVIIICASGRGGYLNGLLSARPFLFLNKFCFSIYMLAPVVIVAMFGLRNEPTNFTEVGSGADFFTVIVLSIMSAFIMLILVELPMQRIANRLFKQRK